MLKATFITFKRFAQGLAGTSRQEASEVQRPRFTLAFAFRSVYAPFAAPRAKGQERVNVPSPEEAPAPLPPDTKLVWVGSHSTPIHVPAK
jgi:hypothetical protein